MHGQLGRHAPLNSNLPAAISQFIKTSKRVVDASGGGKHSLFLTNEGQVYSVGANDYGQLGYESLNPQVEP
jgi:alpha-tubulin suppressor-like RCC1 family protein